MAGQPEDRLKIGKNLVRAAPSLVPARPERGGTASALLLQYWGVSFVKGSCEIPHGDGGIHGRTAHCRPGQRLHARRVPEVLQVGTAHPFRSAPDFSQVEVRRHTGVPRQHLENLRPPFRMGQRHFDGHQPPLAHRVINDVEAVGSAYEQDAFTARHAVELAEELRDYPLLPRRRRISRPPLQYSIDLVAKDDRGAVVAGTGEQLCHFLL